MSTIQDRLEEKRRRVAELREARQQRLQEKVQSRKTHDVDALVSEILGKTEPEHPVEEKEPVVVEREKSDLSTSQTAVINIPPETRELYSKSIQTDVVSEEGQQTIVQEVPAAVVVEERTEAEEEIVEEPNVGKTELTDDDREAIVQSTEFQSFVNRTSRLVDRALAAVEEWDPFVDYARAIEHKKHITEKKPLTLKSKFEQSQPVAQLAFSPRHPELLAVAYAGEDLGSVKVWNMITSLEEFSFSCQSAVLSAFFHPFKPNIILGGSMSGQVLRWDMAANKENPIQRSALSAATHSGPVFSMAVVGVENAHSLVSADTNGRVCSWSPMSLTKPTEVLDVLRPQGGQSRSVAVTCMVFQKDEVNTFYAGAEDGGVYICHRSTGGVVTRLDAHSAPVCSIDCQPDDVLLSAGMDWRVVISTPDKVIHAIDFSDSVYNAKWSPTHPAVFAVGDGTGTLSLWNINEDVEEPMFKFSDNEHAINSIRWSSDGQQIACGNAAGAVYLLQVHVDSADEGVSGGAASVFEW